MVCQNNYCSALVGDGIAHCDWHIEIGEKLLEKGLANINALTRGKVELSNGADFDNFRKEWIEEILSGKRTLCAEKKCELFAINDTLHCDDHKDEEPMDEFIRCLSEDTDDPINHPVHYTQDSIEPMTIMEDCGWAKDAYASFVLKYLIRHRHKGELIKDLKKAQFYLNRLIELEEADV